MTFVKLNNQPKHFDGIMKELLNEIPSALGKTFREDILGFPPVNIFENALSYHLEIAAPGMNKTDFSIKLESNLLTISATKKGEANDESFKSIRKEFSFKGFKRTFTIDEKIDVSNIGAKYENGILNIELPKKEEVKVEGKEINIA